MTGVKDIIYRPSKAAAKVYAELYQVYYTLYNSFSAVGGKGPAVARDEGLDRHPRPCAAGVARMMKTLKQRVCKANCELVSTGLVTLTWGNVSGIDRERGLVVIKPSGVPYCDLKPQQMVVVDLDGKVVEGDLNPSSDTPTHVALYRAFQNIGGIVHTHSRNATIFAQARREIPCLGTTHADHFFGAVPVTRPLTEQEVAEDYEGNTGTVIIERFAGQVLTAALDPDAMPAVLVAGHAPICLGPSGKGPGKRRRSEPDVRAEAFSQARLAARAEVGWPDSALLARYSGERGRGEGSGASRDAEKKRNSRSKITGQFPPRNIIDR